MSADSGMDIANVTHSANTSFNTIKPSVTALPVGINSCETRNAAVADDIKGIITEGMRVSFGFIRSRSLR